MINKQEIYDAYIKNKSYSKTCAMFNIDPAIIRGTLQARGINLNGQGIYKKSGDVCSPRHVTLGSSIAMLRIEKGFMDSANFAHIAGLSAKKLTMIEQGRRDPLFTDLLRIADGLRVPVGDIMNRIKTEEEDDNSAA